MNQPNTDVKKNGIIVIESLKNNERKTGKELYDDKLKWKEIIREDMFVEYYPVYSKKDFIDTLHLINNKMKEGEVFTLHFETHGNDDGVGLASGDIILWNEFYDLIRPINIKMGHLLLIVMAMCKGGALVSKLDISKRAPYKAFIAAFKNVTFDVISRGFEAFYEKYYGILDVFESFESLCKEIDDDKKQTTFWLFTEEQILQHTFDLDRDPIFFQNQLLRLYNTESSKGQYIPIPTIEEKLRSEMHNLYIKHRDYYCFKDLYN